MKYTKDQFKRVLECFDSTIAFAEKIGTVSFNCNPLFDTMKASCRRYCPVYRKDSTDECVAFHDAAYWQFAKEKFIIENEPQD